MSKAGNYPRSILQDSNIRIQDVNILLFSLILYRTCFLDI